MAEGLFALRVCVLGEGLIALVLLVERTAQGLWNRAWRSIWDCCSLSQSWPPGKSCRGGPWLVRNEFKRSPLCPRDQGPCYALHAQLALCWWGLDCTACRDFLWYLFNIRFIWVDLWECCPWGTGPCDGDAVNREEGWDHSPSSSSPEARSSLIFLCPDNQHIFRGENFSHSLEQYETSSYILPGNSFTAWFDNAVPLLETLVLRGTLPHPGGCFDLDILFYLKCKCLQQSAIWIQKIRISVMHKR